VGDPEEREVIISLLAIGLGIVIILWAQHGAERGGRGGGWGGLARTLILIGGCFAAGYIAWVYLGR
jgi:hypothetical protein